ncbi:hypothetical protein ACIGYQ_48330, partial [Streptomyces sp. NPDC053726]
MEALDGFQELIGQIAKSVAGAGSGRWNEAYAKAMSTFGSGAGADYVKNLKDTAAKISGYARETGYQIDYTNRMIIVQVVQFLFEWALTLIMAVFNPIAALMEQSFLRALYRLILRSFLLRLLATVGMYEALNVGLGAAMDIFVRWSLAGEGKHTENGGQYFRQSVAFGAVQGALMVFVPYAGSALAGLIGKGLGRDIAGEIGGGVDRAMAGGGRDISTDVGRDVSGGLGRDLGGKSGDDVGSGPVGGVGGRGGFGRDLGITAANLAQRFEMGEVNGGARDAFRAGAGSLFARDFGGVMGAGPARLLGGKWADGFLAGFGRKDFGDILFRSLDGLPPGLGSGLRSALSHGVADALSTDWGRKFSGFLGDAVANVAHQNASEGLYNLFTTGRFTTSVATGVAGGAGGLLSHALTRNALSLGAGLRDLVLPPKPDLPPAGSVNPVPGPGSRINDGTTPYRFTIRPGGEPSVGLLDNAGPAAGGGDDLSDTTSIRSASSASSGDTLLNPDSPDLPHTTTSHTT